VAKNIVEAKLARRCEVQIAYAIGVARPVSIMVQTFGTGVMPDERLEKIVDEVFDLTPRGIIDALKLKRPIYSRTAAYGHFGRKPVSGVYKDSEKQQRVDFFTWEQTDRVKALLSAAR
jgi:S-adenosylmethionine synthetase